MLEPNNGIHSLPIDAVLGRGMTAETPDLEALCRSLWHAFERFVKLAAGAACVVLGAALTLTFWLLPLGIPLALFGTAVLCSDSAPAVRGASLQSQ